SITKEGYIKRTSIRSYAASNWEDFGKKDTDELIGCYEINTMDVLLLFTNKGNYLYCPVHQLKELRWKDLGQHISGIYTLESDEKIIKSIPINNFDEEKYLLFITKNGMVKKSELSLYKAQRYTRPLI